MDHGELKGILNFQFGVSLNYFKMMGYFQQLFLKANIGSHRENKGYTYSISFSCGLKLCFILFYSIVRIKEIAHFILIFS